VNFVVMGQGEGGGGNRRIRTGVGSPRSGRGNPGPICVPLREAAEGEGVHKLFIKNKRGVRNETFRSD